MYHLAYREYIFGVGKETAFEALVGSTPSGIY